MKFSMNQPRYLLPLLLLPLLCILFFLWHRKSARSGAPAPRQAALKSSVGEVSAAVKQKQLADKLDTYRATYKQSEGYTAVGIIPREMTANPGFKDSYSAKEKQQLDSLDRAARALSRASPRSSHDQALAAALNNISSNRQPRLPPQRMEPDPMSVFKQQLTYMDSLAKVHDPAFQAAQQKKSLAELAARQNAAVPTLAVSRVDDQTDEFNTVRPGAQDRFITAVIDENQTGFAGSRLKLKLLEDIKAGNQLITKGTSLYAQISGFSEQRVLLSITTILSQGQILPVKLDVYDLDGLPGLYVPASAFRDFTKDLGSSTVQGVTLDGSSDGSQFLMSSVKKLFQSSSSAIADLIKKNKAKLKYNSFLYLIDKDALQKSQRSY